MLRAAQGPASIGLPPAHSTRPGHQRPRRAGALASSRPSGPHRYRCAHVGGRHPVMPSSSSATSSMYSVTVLGGPLDPRLVHATRRVAFRTGDRRRSGSTVRARRSPSSKLREILDRTPAHRRGGRLGCERDRRATELDRDLDEPVPEPLDEIRRVASRRVERAVQALDALRAGIGVDARAASPRSRRRGRHDRSGTRRTPCPRRAVPLNAASCVRRDGSRQPRAPRQSANVLRSAADVEHAHTLEPWRSRSRPTTVATIEFECVDSLISRWVNVPILEGKTYPYLPFVDDVRTILDAGANCGAATVHLARHYPDAEIHTFEPGSLPFEIPATQRRAVPQRSRPQHRVALRRIVRRSCTPAPTMRGRRRSSGGRSTRRRARRSGCDPRADGFSSTTSTGSTS